MPKLLKINDVVYVNPAKVTALRVENKSQNNRAGYSRRGVHLYLDEGEVVVVDVPEPQSVEKEAERISDCLAEY